MPFIGSRTSFTVVYAVGAVIAGRSILGFLRGQAINVRTQLALLVLVPLAVVALAGLYQAGIFDKFIGRFTTMYEMNNPSSPQISAASVLFAQPTTAGISTDLLLTMQRMKF